MLIRLNSATERYGYVNDSIFYAQREMQNDNCKWFIEKDGINYIDTDEYEKQSELNRKCFIYSTEALYWLMSMTFKRQVHMAEYLAQKSKKFKDYTSWNTFIENSLFSIPTSVHGEKIQTKLKYTMRVDFLVISVIRISKMIKEGFDFESKWDEVYA